jgi:hypothetical protein
MKIEEEGERRKLWEKNVGEIFFFFLIKGDEDIRKMLGL